MANHLKVADITAIRALVERGWSYRRIARELGVHRETVAKYARAPDVGASKPAKAPTGSSRADGVTNADELDAVRDSKPASAHRVAEGAPAAEGVRPSSRSACEAHRGLIVALVDQGLSARRIWQDLRDRGVELSYHSVKRFTRPLRGPSALPFRRMESMPGVEAQIDFGRGAPVVTVDGRRRKTWFLRVVLSCSRKGYTEAVFRQTTDELIRCLENAFDALGGIPETLVFDNAKSAVIKPDLYDPELNPKFAAFCEHVGTVFIPTKPRMPRHKGKVESDVDYVKDNALKARTFVSLTAQNAHLVKWEASVADTRIHGTTRKQVKAVFDDVERAALRPLPAERFPFFDEATRIVHRDGHVEVAKAYYSVPPEYLGQTVWARWDARTVRILDRRLRPIVVHVRRDPGQFSSDLSHLHPHKVSPVERGAGDLLEQTRWIGSHAHVWSRAMLDARGVQGVRILVGLHALTKKHATGDIDDACEIAASHGSYRLRAIRDLIRRRGPKQDRFEFMESHDIIRSLDEYTAAASRAIRHAPEVKRVSPAIKSNPQPEAIGAGDQDRSAGRGPGPQASPRKGSGAHDTRHQQEIAR